MIYKIQTYKVKLVGSSTKSVKVDVVKEVEDAVKVLRTYLEGEDREHFVVLMLDIKWRIIGIYTISIGTLTGTLVHPREVFKAAILANAHAIILGHNHPTGEPALSIDDLDITRLWQSRQFGCKLGQRFAERSKFGVAFTVIR